MLEFRILDGNSNVSCTRRICNRDYVVKESAAKFVWAVAVAVADAIFARPRGALKEVDEKAADKGRAKKGALMLPVIAVLTPIPLWHYLFCHPSLHFCVFCSTEVA